MRHYRKADTSRGGAGVQYLLSLDRGGACTLMYTEGVLTTDYREVYRGREGARGRDVFKVRRLNLGWSRGRYNERGRSDLKLG